MLYTTTDVHVLVRWPPGLSILNQPIKLYCAILIMQIDQNLHFRINRMFAYISTLMVLASSSCYEIRVRCKTLIPTLCFHVHSDDALSLQLR